MLTALVPTVGHQFAVEFAADFMETNGGQLTVIISTRDCEPTSYLDRASALTSYGVRYVSHHDNLAPQQPSGEDDVAFWDYYKNVCEDAVGGKVDFIFASESYGIDMAKVLNAQFIPINIERDVYQARGTTVRQDVFSNQENIAPSFRSKLYSNIVIFGADSCGKTTTARRLALEYNGRFVPEYARGYLEAVGTDVDAEKMVNIAIGQYALERSVLSDYNRPLVTVFDTDVLTTLGYYRLYGIIPDRYITSVVKRPVDKLYVVLKENIPFEKDVLRKEERESNTKYWIDLLEEFGRDYVVIESSSFEDRMAEIDDVVDECLPHGNKGLYQRIRSFKR